MKELIKELWIPIVLLVILIAVMIIFNMPFRPHAFITGFVGGGIGTLLYYLRSK